MSIASLYPSINPSLLLDFANVKRLDPRITFTRTTTATYYDGVTTAMAEQNLLQQSQTFDNAYWNTAGNVTISSNSTTAPDGTSTADTMTEAATTATHRLSAAFNGAVVSGSLTSAMVFTVSCYYKIASGTPYARLSYSDNSGSNQANAWFNLSAGTLGSTSTVGSATVVTSTITSVGSSWYRCTFTASINAGSDLYVYIAMADADASVSYAGSTGRAVYIWGAQLEQRSSATAYTATTTQAITNYIPVLQTASAGQARFDHNPTTGESLGLLIEEQRANLVLRSEDFTTTWTNQETTEQSNVIIAPDGTLTGDKLIATTANDSHWINQTVTTTAAAHTFSFYAKAGEYRYVQVLNSNDATDRINFDLVAGVLGSASAYTGTITPVGNGWYRCTATYTTTATTAGWARIGIVSSATSARGAAFAGDGFSGVYLWGAQFETGAFPTSYIPTVAASVTRNADAASMTGTNFSSWFNNGEGTLYGETESVKGTYPHIAGLQSSSSNNIYFYLQNSAGAYWSALDVVTNGSTQVGINTTTSASTNRKSSTGYKANDFGVVLNGGTVVTDTSGTVPVISQMDIGCRGGTQYFANGCIKKLAYYPIKATSTQLQALTS